MKAWQVEDTNSYEGGCTVVFAETRGKAHDLARGTDCCEDAEWCDIRVTRIPEEECKKYNTNDCMMIHGKKMNRNIFANDFCSYGERKDEGL